MTKKFFAILALATVFFGCTMSELDAPEAAVEMKTIRLGAGMLSDEETRAQISSETGAFTWEENDKINVLATDGKFYVLTLVEGAGTKNAEFEGEIPEESQITGVAVYPATIAAGTENAIYNAQSGILNYNIPTEYDYVPNSTYLPMIASVETDATEVSFRQIGAVVRFPVNGLPSNAKVVFTAKNLTITGGFDVDVNQTGTAKIVAAATEGMNTSITVNYSADTYGSSADINFPVPTGTYNNFSIEIIDGQDNSIFKKDYAANKVLNRANLLLMKAIDAPMTFTKVWPYFTDARIAWKKFSGATHYAIYLDDATEPVIVEDTTEGDEFEYVIGGNFAHGTEHKVAVAKVVDGNVDLSTKSSYAEFTTGEIRQLTYNTGTRFVSVAWDDVAIGMENSTQYEDGRWTIVAQDNSKNNRNMRGYRVQLYKADKTTKLYEEVPFSGQCDNGGAFAYSSWFGKKDGENILYPCALSFGWLEPNTKYYFRVQTLEEPVVFDEVSDGYFGTSSVTLYSLRGGSGWSDFYELTTDAEYQMWPNEVFHEGFDDMMYNNDIMNMCAAVVPQVLTSAGQAYTNSGRDLAEAFQNFSKADWALKKWDELGFNTMLNVYNLGMTDAAYKKNTAIALNSYAGTLAGWSVYSDNEKRAIYPNFGAVRLGQSGSNESPAEMRTPALNTGKLSEETACIITVQVSSASTTSLLSPDHILINHYRDGSSLSSTTHYFNKDEDGNILPEWSQNYQDTEATNYLHYPTWFTVKQRINLKDGDIIGFNRKKDGNLWKGTIVIGDVKIEIAPQEERYYGTAPDNTNYDVWGLNGKLPISFWVGPPVLDNMNVDAMSEAEINEVKTQYFDPMIEGGYTLIEVTNPYPNTMKKILEWCQAAGVQLLDKSIGHLSYDGTIPTQAATHVARISEYYNHPSYGGAFVGPDEPGNCAYPDIDIVNDAYAANFPGKGRVVNLLPSYAANGQLTYGASKACDGVGHSHPWISSYETYVRNFANTVDVSCIFFDHYCLEKSAKAGTVNRGKVKSKHYYDLDVVRHFSLQNGVPFLMYTHGRPQWEAGYTSSNASGYVAPTVEKPTSHVYDEQRWLVWSQLAMGSKGVAYYCYWTPGGHSGGPFSWDAAGNKTRMYDILKNINTEIQPIGSILMTCHADGAMMTGPGGNFVLYENDGYGLANYGPVLELQKGNSEDVVAGCFRDAVTGEYKVLVTHKAPATNDTEAATASIASLRIDTSMATSVTLHTVTITSHEAAATTVVSTADVSSGSLELTIPDGTAVLVEFPQTANNSYN